MGPFLIVGRLYLFLYVTLQLQDYALLATTIGLLAVLSALMYATRNVDWFRLESGLETR